MNRKFISSACFVLAYFWPTAQLRGQIDKPVWTRNMADDPATNGRFNERMTGARVPELSFLSNTRLMLSFDDHAPLDAHRYGKTIYAAMAIDAEKGVDEKVLNFPALPGASELKPTSEGGFVLLSGKALTLYSKELARLKEIEVTEPCCMPLAKIAQIEDGMNCIYNQHRLDVTPGDMQVLYRSVMKPGVPYAWSWFATSDLARGKTLSAVNAQTFHAGNDFLILQTQRAQSTLLSRESQNSICNACWNTYVVSDRLLLEDFGRSYELTDRSGKKVHQGSLRSSIELFARSRNTSRFLYATVDGGPGDFGAFNVGPRKVRFQIHVIDSQTMKEVAEVRYEKKVRGDSTGASQAIAALSPDGRMVALLDDGILSLFNLGN